MSPRDNTLPDDASRAPRHEQATGTIAPPHSTTHGMGTSRTFGLPEFPKPKRRHKPAPRHRHGEGVRCRLAEIRGETPRDLLRHPLWVPAILAPLQYTDTADFNEFTTINDGEFATPMGGDRNARKLRSIDNLDALTIYWDAPWLVEHGYSVGRVERTLFGILQAKRPVQMLLVDKHRHYQTTILRMDVTFRSLSWEMRAGEPDTHYLALAIKEHRDMSQGRRGEAQGRKRGVRLPARPRLRNTDTLASLSMEFYGTYRRWREIRDANGLSTKFGSHGIIVYNTRFVTGQKIKIPKLPSKLPSEQQGNPRNMAQMQGLGGAQAPAPQVEPEDDGEATEPED